MTKFLQRVWLGVLVACLAHAAFAQDNARQPIKLIVPFPAGAAPDLMARLVAIKAAEQLDQAIVIDNRVGAGGSVGAAVAAQSPSDGLTLFLGTAGTHGINSSLYKKLPYDPIRDFVPVVALSSSTNVLVAGNELGARTLPEFVALAKREPGKFVMGTGTNGTTTHLAGVMLNKAAGIETLCVPIRTTSARRRRSSSGSMRRSTRPCRIRRSLPASRKRATRSWVVPRKTCKNASKAKSPAGRPS